MTGKTLRELLPAGSPRNKIEFLADELQHGLELLNALSGETVVNFITNGDFTATPAISAGVFYSAAAPQPKMLADLQLDAFLESSSPAAFAPLSWGCEAVGYEGNNYPATFGVQVDWSGANVTNRDHLTVGRPLGVKAAATMKGMAYRAALFAPFYPSVKRFGFEFPTFTVAASIRAGSQVKWGLVELNPGSGNIKQVLFCEDAVSDEPNHHILRKDGLKLDANKQYALVISNVQPDMGYGGQGVSVGWACAFQNEAQSPTLLPNVWPQEQNNEFRVIKRLTHAEVVAGVSIDTSPYAGLTSARNKHLVFRLARVNEFGEIFSDGQQCEEIRNGDIVTISVPGAMNNGADYAICACITPYPQHIGFFKPDGTTAFDTLQEYVIPK
ncbi:hypothetical protein ACUYOF_07455 [Photobacterium ganghwense]|uniref:hypothetical protein n=1 Tax=Photobacterium ganghwense TaxID=320778 RepID=UPI00405793D0